MKKINLRFLFPFTALIILVIALSNQLMNIPPLGMFLNPFLGISQNDKDADLDSPFLDIGQLGLSDSVDVYFDDRRVPHIYAKNANDIYFAQGYVTASLRLWQMDFFTYATAGRMSEIFNIDDLLSYDRNQRRLGLLYAAEQTLEYIQKDPETISIIQAYTRGVNAYINGLNYRTMPFEYKFLDYRPEPWTNLKTVLILKALGNTLTGYEEDLLMSKMILALGDERFNLLFPEYVHPTTPILNNDLGGNNNDSARALSRPAYLDSFFLTSNDTISKSSYNPNLGSNSWVVSGKKTKSGHPILANDPHLNLTLPSFWLEMQLITPEMNVYGVTIPGAPSIIIGFNEKIAWGITNGADDVKDWYKLKLSNDSKKYQMDGKWIDLKYRIEEIKRRNNSSVYDTIYRSIHGPILADKDFKGNFENYLNYALKWELYNPSNEFKAFINLNTASSYANFIEAVKNVKCPVLNFTYAGPGDTIAVIHQGNMGIKQLGQGKFILDGTKGELITERYIPQDRLPQVVNPSNGFVISANQRPTSPDYDYYYNGYYSETRASQIFNTLNDKSVFDIDRMKSLQLDNTNRFALDALPVFIASLNLNKLKSDENKAVSMLDRWSGKYDRDNVEPKLFEIWLGEIRKNTWDEFEKPPFNAKLPADYVLLDLIRKDPSNIYFDKVETSPKENASDIITESFSSAYKGYKNFLNKDSVKWGDFNKVNVMHLTNLSAFGRTNLSSSGHPNAINAMSVYWGPTWRMIVELGDVPKAFGVFPGGESGNIGSKYYDNYLDDWNNGIYYKLQFFLNKNEANKVASSTWRLH
ncbi:penicillin acylase family protein [Sphingobacterium kitahiroshimense]|uniref:Penicillin acylase family protein n=1 Tax=Sphingobacterium kitahiroshimense TaxID=470446 RepID=A0ABV0BM63_9SPHI